MNKRIFSLLALAVCLSFPAAAQQFIFDMRGSQEVPPVPSTASGGCYGELNQGAATFALTCVHDVENATVMHIHRGAIGVNGSIAFDMGDPASGFVTATWAGMTPADIADLLAGNLYVNIHTAGRPAGEIRGQILPRTVDTVAFTADGSQVVPPNDTTATASCTANLNDGATALDIACTHNFPSPDAAHIHEAPFGEIGPIVFTFPTPSVLNASVPMTPRLIADFAAVFLYLDVHATGGTEEEPAAAIRGQIGTPPAGAGTGTVIIEKQAYGSSGFNFSFNETIENGSFVLADDGTKTFASVALGMYSVTEFDHSGANHTLAGISCNDADSTTNVSTRTATINVAAGETVRCTFSNVLTAPTDSLFVFHLSGDQEVPPVTTTERGGCMARFDAANSQLTIVCTHNVDSPTIAHIHRAPVGENGSIAFDLGSPISPIIATWQGMTPSEVADLLAGNFYVNIHTAGRPAGAVRGQIVPRTVDTVNFALDAAQVVPPGTSASTGNCTANLNDPATQIAFSCTHNMPAPDSAHVHQGERGQNGPVVFTFASPASPINESMPVTPRLVADFAADLLYLDIHGPAGGDEETADQIRGQVATPIAVVTTGTIQITKATSPAGGTGFTFTDNVPGSAGAFALNDGQTFTFTNVPAGTWTITENAMAGWTLTNVTCTDGDSTGDVFARTATVRLQAAELVQCTFTNLQTQAPTATPLVFHLSDDQEVPPSGSTARGGCYGQLDQAAQRLSLVCVHNVQSPTIAHIHRGAPGVNGPIAFDLGDPISPIEATWQMTLQDMNELLAGNLYVNIHAGGRPEGEIRGQIVVRSVDRYTFGATGGQEVPPTDSTATGNCTADLSDAATSVLVQCTHNVDNVTAAHLHEGAPGVDGPILFDFPTTNAFSQNVPLAPRAIADFAAGFLYVNIHSVDYETGEIRGNLTAPPAPAAGVAAVPTASEWMLMVLAIGLALVAWRRVLP